MSRLFDMRYHDSYELRRGSMMTRNCFVDGKLCPSIAIDRYLPYDPYNQGITHPQTYLIILNPAILLAPKVAKYRSHASFTSCHSRLGVTFSILRYK